MGGPCFKIIQTRSWDESSKASRQQKVPGPACTDNFQIIKFSYLGLEWWSVEQCYQALKFSGDMRETIQQTLPHAEETGSIYGIMG